jgi:hypothetical protein
MEIYSDPSAFLAGMLARLSEPASFRFVIQPLIAVLLGRRDGVRDARAGRPPYLWSVVFDPELRRTGLRSGVVTTIKLFLMAIAIDTFVAAVLAGGAIYPGTTLLVGILVVALPYSAARALSNRLVRHKYRSQSPQDSGQGGAS